MTMVIEGGIDEIPNNILGTFYDIKLAYRYSAADMNERFYPQINFQTLMILYLILYFSYASLAQMSIAMLEFHRLPPDGSRQPIHKI